MREYHIDTDPSFQAIKPGPFIQKPVNAQPKIAICMDETVFKQNTFSNTAIKKFIILP